MPPLPRIRTEALADLARQLRFTPRETVRRQLDRALELAGELDPALEYPPEWIVFRVTGHRADLGAAAPVPGAALLADLSAFCERLSHAAGITPEDLPGGGGVGAAALAAQWNISRKSLERYRRAGLIALRVRADGAPSRLVFPLHTLDQFRARHQPRLDKARRFSRIPPGVEARILRRAAIYRRRFGCSLNQAALRLSTRFGRGLETVRQLLRRHDAESGAPVFTEPPPMTAFQRRVAWRAWRLGINPGDVAHRYGHRRPAVRRVITDERAARLRALALPASPAPPPPAEDPIAPPPAITDLHALLDSARTAPPADAEEERGGVEAWHALAGRASALISTLPEHGASPRVVDEAETLLRRAARVKAGLIACQLPIVVRSLEAAIGRPLEEVRSAALAPLLAASIDAVSEVIDSFDPARARRTSRLAAPVGLALTRVAARFAREFPADAGGATALAVRSRATPRLRPGVPVPDWTLRVARWQTFLEPDPRVRANLAILPAPARELLAARFGWETQPRTLADLARARRTTIIKVAMLERKAIHDAIRAARPS